MHVNNNTIAINFHSIRMMGIFADNLPAPGIK